MSFSKTLLLGFAVVSLSACSTTPSIPDAGEVLLAGIEAPSVTVPGALPSLSATSPTCLQFYQNTGNFVSLPSPELAGATGPSFGSQLLKTVVLGTLAGVVSGGVASIGIDNSFAEAALIGTASQVTFSTGGTIYDSIVGDGIPDVEVPTVPALTPMQEIEKIAGELGCPAPDQAAIAALDIGQ